MKAFREDHPLAQCLCRRGASGNSILKALVKVSSQLVLVVFDMLQAMILNFGCHVNDVLLKEPPTMVEECGLICPAHEPVGVELSDAQLPFALALAGGCCAASAGFGNGVSTATFALSL